VLCCEISTLPELRSRSKTGKAQHEQMLSALTQKSDTGAPSGPTLASLDKGLLRHSR